MFLRGLLCVSTFIENILVVAVITHFNFKFENGVNASV